jgi:hypothetical protein
VRSPVRLTLISVSVLMLMAVAVPSSATHATRPSEDIEALGHSPHPASFTDPAASLNVNSDLAFWGNRAYNGNYNGFRIIDISNPANPQEIIWYDDCNGSQGDLVVWENILVRSWDAPAPAGRMCGGDPVPEGFEGLHVFDISNETNPALVGSLELECGSHTVTVAGVEGGNLILYNNISSSVNCEVPPGDPPNQALDDPTGDFMDIVAVPLANPAGINLVRREPLAGPGPAIPPNPAPRTGCHDVGVIRLDVNKAVCASADTINVFDIGDNSTAGGTLTDPELLFTIMEPGVGQSGTNGRWHSGAWTWDGEVIIAGWEPGGGGQAECEATDPDVDKSMFFFDETTGAKLGQWVLPRPQGADENCTIHNYNIVPLTSGRYIAVGGHYQAGTWVVDFTNPAAPQTVAWSDPPTLGPGPFCTNTLPPGCQLGGAWSSYWYNDFVYESEIQAGLNVFEVEDARLSPALAIDLPFLNPQTQMEPTPGFFAGAVAAGPRCKGRNATHLGTSGNDEILGTDGPDVVLALGGRDVVKSRDGNDVVCGGPGNDRLRMGNSEKGGADRAFGQGGRDRLFGQGGRDVLRGGAKKDLIKAGSGKDRLFGQGGNDNLRGQGGADKMNGGGGRDLCNGGAGQDSATKCERVQLVP